jgi:hypothetical protein
MRKKKCGQNFGAPFMTAFFAVMSRKARFHGNTPLSASLSLTICRDLAGRDSPTGPPVRSHHLSGPFGRTAVNSRASSASLRGELHRRYHTFHYTGGCFSMSSNLRSAGRPTQSPVGFDRQGWNERKRSCSRHSLFPESRRFRQKVPLVRSTWPGVGLARDYF